MCDRDFRFLEFEKFKTSLSSLREDIEPLHVN